MSNALPAQTTMTDLLARAAALEEKADTLHMSLLAPSMREDALRAESARLYAQAEAAAEPPFGR